MTRIILILSLGILFSLQTAYGQLNINFADASGDPGTQVSVDVTTSNFPDLVLFQYSVNWDSTVMRINSITNVNTTLPTYNAANSFGLPASSVDVIAGQLTTTWDHPSFTPTTLPAGTRLYTMVFDLVGNAGDMTSLVISDNPKDREAVIGDFSTDVGVVSNTGTVTINGGGGGGNDDLMLIVSEEIAAPGSTACVEVSVANFEDIESAQFTLEWDPTILTYTTVQSFDLPGLDINAFNSANAASGSLIFFWSEPNGNLASKNDGDVIFEVCYDVIGTLGQMSNVNIVGSPVAIEVFGNGITYDPSTNNLSIDNGKVTVDNPPTDPLVFSLGNELGADAGARVCLPVSIENFNDIVSFGYSITYDPAELQAPTDVNDRVANLNLGGLSASGSFNLVSPGQLNVSWSAPSGGNTTEPDKVIFEVCLDVLEPCVGESHQVRIGKAGINPEVATIVGAQPVAVAGVIYNDGEVMCGDLPTTCDIDPIAADCGDNQGDLFVTLENAANDCECVWTGPVNMTSTVSAGCNLLGVPAGDYTLTINCNGSAVCVSMATIDPAPTVSIAGNVTDAGCDGLGSITSIPSGGMPPYTFIWSNSEDTPTITDLSADDYTVTVTSADGCSNMRTFTVSGDVTPVNISMFGQTSVLCNGDNTGSANIVVADGCPPYMYSWTGSTSTSESATDLAAGNASVTVTDKNGMMASMSFTIIEPNPISITASSITPSCPDMMEGSIVLSLSGGTGTLTPSWNMGDGTNLNPNDYDVTITDENGCTASATFTVPVSDPSICAGDCPMIMASASNFNGFGVSCNGDADGSIDLAVSGGEYPITLDLSGPVSGSQSISTAGSVGFDDLPAGVYVITPTNGSGTVCATTTVTISEPNTFSVITDSVGDVSEGMCDGFIDYTLIGGVGTITCMLNGVLEADCDFSDLCAGMYVISFEDANGCTTERMERVTDPVIGPEGSCYQVTSVITPNEDGVNDIFDVSCVDDFPVRLQVFDRWGRLVFNQDFYDGSWDGTDTNGKALPESAYMYVLVIDFGSGRQEVRKGTLTLLRQ